MDYTEILNTISTQLEFLKNCWILLFVLIIVFIILKALLYAFKDYLL